MSVVHKLDSDTKDPTILQAYAKIECTVDAENLAKMFWSMCNEEQAYFFNTLGIISEGKLPMQLQSVTDCEFLEYEGRYAMSLIGDYAAKED